MKTARICAAAALLLSMATSAFGAPTDREITRMSGYARASREAAEAMRSVNGYVATPAGYSSWAEYVWSNFKEAFGPEADATRATQEDPALPTLSYSQERTRQKLLRRVNAEGASCTAARVREILADQPDVLPLLPMGDHWMTVAEARELLSEAP